MNNKKGFEKASARTSIGCAYTGYRKGVKCLIFKPTCESKEKWIKNLGKELESTANPATF